MKIKNFTLILLTALLLAVTFASALDFQLSTGAVKMTAPQTIATFTINTLSGNNTNFAISSPLIRDDNGNAIPLSLSSSAGTLNSINSTTITITAAPDYNNSISIGKDYAGDIIVSENATNNKTVSLSFAKTFCSYGSGFNGEIGSSLKITNIDSRGDNDFDEWAPLDDINIEIEVENNNDSSIKTTVEISLYSISDSKFVKLNGKTKLEATKRISDDDSEIFSFPVKVPADLEEGDYRLYVRAYKDNDQNIQCISQSSELDATLYQKVSVDYGDSEIIVDEIIAPTAILCGGIDRVSMDIYNLNYGDDEKFRVQIFNRELGISMLSEQFTLDDQHSQTINFDLNMPANATGVTHTFIISVDYDYDERDDKYSEHNTDYTFSIKAENCKPTEVKNASVSADFSSKTPKAVIGSQFIIESQIKNTGNVATEYSIEVTGNTGWSSATIDPKTFTLEAGKSKTVEIYFDVDSSAEESEQTFNIRVLSGSELMTESSVKVALEKGITGGAIVQHFKSNWVIYTIVLVNIILLIAIIAVISSMLSSKKGSD